MHYFYAFSSFKYAKLLPRFYTKDLFLYSFELIIKPIGFIYLRVCFMRIESKKIQILCTNIGLI